MSNDEKKAMSGYFLGVLIVSYGCCCYSKALFYLTVSTYRKIFSFVALKHSLKAL